MGTGPPLVRFEAGGFIALRSRILLLSLFVLALGIILIYGSPVVAQSADSVQVLHLSATGAEQAHSVAFSPDGRFLAAGGTAGAYVFDASMLTSPDLIQMGSWAHGVAFVPGTDSLAAGLFDGTIQIWATPQQHLLRTFTGPQNWIRSISFSRDGNLVAAASDDNTIHVWNVAQGSMVLKLDQNITGIRAVALSPDGRLVAGAMQDKTVRVWSVPDGKLQFTLTSHGDWVRCVTFSPDGRVLASGGFDMTVRLWDMSSGQLLRTLYGHTSSVLGLSFSPDGTILASGSTDTTVRLWRVSDGAPLQTLRGHTGFVYSVAFSPDGNTLASGASDNSVRLWKVSAWLSMAAPQAASGPVASTTKDCRACHHRQGSAAPARVVEVPCEACHAGGIGQSWCVAFPRTTSAGRMDTSYHPVHQVSGVPVGGKGIHVLIASPGNSETLYVRGDHMAPEIIAGQVSGADAETVKSTELRLDIIAAGQPTESLISAPTADGRFQFNTAINPKSAPPQLAKPASRQCLLCHGDYQPQAGLPAGIVRLVVTATTPDGDRATDERWVHVDSSRDTSVPVRVVDSKTGAPVPDLLFKASALFYQWRERFGTAISGPDGSANLTLDDSSQVPISYSLSVPVQVVNGVLYSGQPLQAALIPGAALSSAVTVRVWGQLGTVNGTLRLHGDPTPTEAAKIWAIQSPVGPGFQVPSSDSGAFDFNSLPVGPYLITPDLMELARQGLSATTQRVDLMQMPHATVGIPVSRARSLKGSITDTSGRPVAFAWIQVDGKSNANAVDPASGHFIVSGVPDGASYLTVNAPGFYSQSQHIAAGEQSMNFQLVAEPTAQHVTWGQGQVIVPAQTNAQVEGSQIALQTGWIWGGNSVAQPFVIDVGHAQISMSTGEFALESAAGQIGWFYLRDGKASVSFNGNQPPTALTGGQMIGLLSSAAPLPMDETVVLSLHPRLTDSPISEHLEPTLGARLQNWLEKAGISTLQTITFITYFLSLVALITFPLIVLFWINRRRKSADAEEKL